MSGFDRILQMVNQKNTPTYPLTNSSVTLNDVTVEDSPNHNTRVTMRSVPRSGYTGQVDLFYTRVPLTNLGELLLQREESYTYQEVLDIINQAKTAQMTPDDFTNNGLPFIPNGVPLSFLLSAKPSSFVWLGNTQITILTGLPAEAPGLNDFWNNTAATLFD